MAGIGHNSKVSDDDFSIACDEVRLLVERIERVENDIKDLNDDKKDIYLEAKARGYDTKTIRKVVQIRKLSKDVYQEQKTRLDTYLAAFGID